MRRVLAACVVLALGCDPATSEKVYGDEDLLADIAGYEEWGSPADWTGLAISCEAAHGNYVRLYANETALADLAAGATALSAGAALVNASYQDTEGTPKLVAAMRKVPGSAPGAGDWYWGQLDEEGALVLGGAIPACSTCHEASPGYLRHRDGPPPEKLTDCPNLVGE